MNFDELYIFSGNINGPFFSEIHSSKTYDLSTLYTTTPHDELKSRMAECLSKKYHV